MIELNREFNIKNKDDYYVDENVQIDASGMLTIIGDVIVHKNITADLFNYKLKGVMVK